MSTAIVWFRRDLRLADNPALRAAVDRHDHIVPLYIHSPEEDGAWRAGAAGRWWLHHSLASLQDSLQGCGATLVIRQGTSLEVLQTLFAALKAEAIYWNRSYEPLAAERDKRVLDQLLSDGTDAEMFPGSLLHEPWDLKTGAGEPYRVFSPFWRNAESKLRQELDSGRAPLPAVHRIPPSPASLESVALDSLELLPKIGWDTGFKGQWRPGEAGARERANAFCSKRLAHYRQQRDLPAVDAGSELSPHLHFGEISPLQIVVRIEHHLAEHHAAGVRANAEWFIREIGWREFAHQLLFHFPQTPEEPLYEQFKPFPWRAHREYLPDLRAWQRGRTGIPIVDAGMRQLWHIGWMHNRVRMIVASFLTKNLLIPWQEGAAWFWDTLVDADLANNTLGWQWTAGCGADAAPYFRIFNPVLQSEKFDGSGAYIRTWVPELARLPDSALHAPWKAKPALLEAAHFVLGRDYPHPIVDLAGSRTRALEAYAEIRNTN